LVAKVGDGSSGVVSSILKRTRDEMPIRVQENGHPPA